jgi:phenol hydroxylase P4 protein
MPVAALGTYEFAPLDTADKFPAPLLYIGWEEHLMFCAPFCVPMPPTMKFGDMVKGAFPGIFGAHPDFSRIDWSKTEWLKSGQPFAPDFEKSLADNGLKHKDVIRFRTPGLSGIRGSCH